MLSTKRRERRATNQQRYFRAALAMSVLPVVALQDRTQAYLSQIAPQFSLTLSATRPSRAGGGSTEIEKISKSVMLHPSATASTTDQVRAPDQLYVGYRATATVQSLSLQIGQTQLQANPLWSGCRPQHSSSHTTLHGELLRRGVPCLVSPLSPHCALQH